MLFKLFSKKETGTTAKQRAFVRSLHGLPVRYVTQWRNDNEDVIGRGGHLTVKEDELLVDTSGDVLFRCSVREVEASLLMSGDGVILRGSNAQKGGVEETITVHFVYYRK